MEKIKTFFNSFNCKWYGFVILLILIVNFINLSNVYYSNEYKDFAKNRDINFTIINKIHEPQSYRRIAKYLLICKNNEDNKICTIEVTPQTFVMNDINSVVSFNISKEDINRYSYNYIYNDPISNGKQLLIVLLAFIILFGCLFLLYPLNPNAAYFTFSLFITFAVYCIFLIIYTLFFIS